MPIKLSKSSRFRTTEPIIKDGKETFGRWSRPAFMDAELIGENRTIKFHVTQKYAGKAWMIANDVYGSPFLEWVVIMFNRPKNPLNWPRAGSVITLPNPNLVSTSRT